MSSRQLYELQELDGEIEGAQLRLATIEARLGDRGALEALEGNVAALEQRLEDADRTQRAAEMEADSTRERLRALEARLYDGEVTNPRELKGMEQEQTVLRSRLERDEEGLLEVLESREEVEHQLSEAQAEMGRETEIWKQEQERLSQERDAGRATLDGLLERRQGVASHLTEDEIAVYDRLRPAKGGRAVAKLERGMCQGCRMALPTHVVQRARSGREHVFCTSCGRLLYVS